MKSFTDSPKILYAGAAAAVAGLAGILVARRAPIIRSLASAGLATGTPFPLANPISPLVLRVDSSGDGHFSSTRVGHIHQGTDFLCSLNQAVYAPFAGTVMRISTVYPADPQWRGIVMTSIDGYEVKLFYCLPAGTDLVGTYVKRGQLVGFCQAISQKYGGSMKNHLHVELRLDDVLINPETAFRVTRA